MPKDDGGAGKGLSAILVHRITHQNIGGNVGTAVHSKGMASLIDQAIAQEEKALGVKYERIATTKGISVKPTSSEWQPYVDKCKARAQTAQTEAEKEQAAKDLVAVKATQDEIKVVSKEEKAALERIAEAQIRPTLRQSFESGLGHTFNAIKAALELSKVDGPEGEKTAALGSLRDLAKKVWTPLVEVKIAIPDTELDFENLTVPEGGKDKDKPKASPVVATGAMKGEDHKLTVDPEKGEIRLASVEDEARKKVQAALTKVRAMNAPEAKKQEAVNALQSIDAQLVALEAMFAGRKNKAPEAPKPESVAEMKKKTDAVMKALQKYGEDFGVHDVVELPSFDKFFAERFTVTEPKDNKVKRANAFQRHFPKQDRTPMLGKEKLPGYVVNMTSIPSEVKSGMAKRYFDAAWAGSEHKSLATLRTAVVAGINAFRSLDPERESKTLEAIAQGVAKVEYEPKSLMAVFGFMWEPLWTEKDKGAVTLEHVRDEWKKLPASERELARRDAEASVTSHLPYGIFRNEVLESEHTKAAVQRVGQVTDPVHILTQDGDGQVAAAGGGGVLTEYDNFLKDIARHPLLTIGGYRFAGFDWGEDANPRTQQLTLLANEIDRAVRAAIAKVFPEMLYPTEPNMLIKAQDKTNRDGVLDKKIQGGLFGQKTAEGRVAKSNILANNTGENAHPNPVAYAPNTSITTSPVPERPERGLTVPEENVPKAASGQLYKERTKAKKVRKDKSHGFVALEEQSQSHLRPRMLAHELSETFGLDVDERVRDRILNNPADLAQQLTENPNAELDVEKNNASLDEKASKLKELDSFQSEKAKKSVDMALAIAKEIVAALTADEMRSVWERVSKILNEVSAEVK